MKTKPGQIRVGIGGWSFEPWRGVFYPKGLPQAKELAYASAHLTSIEINSTFYGSQKPETFRKWARETPADFVFSVKGPRFATNRRVLAEAGELDRALSEVRGARARRQARTVLVAIRADQEIRRGRFRRLPRAAAARSSTAAACATWSKCGTTASARRRSSRCCESLRSPWSTPSTRPIRKSPTSTGDFIYARLQKGKDTITTGYPPKALDEWAERFKIWAKGGAPADLPRVEFKPPAKAQARDVFVYFIHEGKVRAPAAAIALIERLKR